MPSTPEDRDTQAEGYEAPKVEEISSETGPAVTAAGDTPTDDIAISLVEDDE
jgi:hypothetical protein